MNRYFALSGGLHVLAALFLLLFLGPSMSKPQATYTIDFIGTGKVQAVTGQEAAAPAPAPAEQKPEPKAEPVKTATPEPQPKAKETPKAKPAPKKKAYTAKSEITTKKQDKKKKVEVAEPLAAPSILEEDTGKMQSADNTQNAFNGGSIQTDFADFPYPWYITQVRNSLWIEWEKRRPEGTQLSALISFAIARNGKIKNVKIERSSKDETFDYAAKSAVLSADPFAPLPMYYEKDILTISVEFKQEN